MRAKVVKNIGLGRASRNFFVTLHLEMTMKQTIILSAMLVVVACGKGNDEAKQLLDEARVALDEHRYGDVLAKIDTLRSRYPRAVEERKAALPLWQKAELLRTQDDLAVVDSALNATERELEQAKTETAQASESGNHEAWRQLNRRTNMLQMRRDSLKNRFDVACAKIKYIHKKQKEI